MKQLRSGAEKMLKGTQKDWWSIRPRDDKSLLLCTEQEDCARFRMLDHIHEYQDGAKIIKSDEPTFGKEIQMKSIILASIVKDLT